MGGSPSHLRALLRLAWQEIGVGPSGRGEMAGLRGPIAVEQNGISTTPRSVSRYLNATQGKGLVTAGAPGAPLPPICPAIWETALAIELLAKAGTGIPRRGLLHLGGERLQLRPLTSNDRIRCRIELAHADRSLRGLRLRLLSRSWNAAGQLCSQAETVYLLRAPTAGANGVLPEGRGSGGEEGYGERDPIGDEQEIARWELGSDHGRRYARASGDFNPVHLWGWTARPFGYRRPILHGFCIEALVAHALIVRFWEGDPTALRLLRITFRAPLLLPARVGVRAVEDRGAGRGRFAVVGEQGRRFAFGEFVGG